MSNNRKLFKLLAQICGCGLIAGGAASAHAGGGLLGQSGYLTAGHFKVESEDYSAVEINYTAEATDVLAIKYGAGFYDGAPVKYGRDDFVGVTLAGYYHFDQTIINPYIGLGVFAGRTYNCSSAEKEHYGCEEESMFSLYPELGLAIKLDQFFIYPYVRRSFSTNNGGEAANVIGLAVGFGI